jgi:hypothetical protein
METVMIIKEPKQINLRDKVSVLKKFLNEYHSEEEMESQLFDALWMLTKCQDALIKLDDEHWDELGLDYEFIL